MSLVLYLYDLESKEHLAECRKTGDWPIELFRVQITHNLTRMAGACGLYPVLWRHHRLHPDYDLSVSDCEEECCFHLYTPIRAATLIAPLIDGIKELATDRAKYEHLNPENGYGSYDTLAKSSTDLLAACIRYPDATVVSSR